MPGGPFDPRCASKDLARGIAITTNGFPNYAYWACNRQGRSDRLMAGKWPCAIPNTAMRARSSGGDLATRTAGGRDDHP